MTTWRVVQLTDTHLFEDPAGTQKGVNTRQTLNAVIADMAVAVPEYDALLLTGDLSQDETRRSYDLLKNALAPVARAAVYAIPGNHDDLGYMRESFTGAGFHVLSDVLLGRWRIIMLNSQVPGRVHGELGRDELDRLRSGLKQDDRHVIVALHHPPVAIGSAWIDNLGCMDGAALLSVVAGTSVKVILCGHVHQVFEGTRDGVSVLTTPSTCVQFRPGAGEFAIDAAALPGYRILDLADDGSWSTRVIRVGGGSPPTE